VVVGLGGAAIITGAIWLALALRPAHFDTAPANPAGTSFLLQPRLTADGLAFTF
jgi:hypothetical protein